MANRRGYEAGEAIVKTWWANIYVGRRFGYEPWVGAPYAIKDICRAFCNRVKLCVTVTETYFVYADGEEPGAIVGLIQYPRFPKTEYELRGLALALGEKLLVGLRQHRVTVQMIDETILLGETDEG